MKALFPDGLADFYLEDGTLLKVREGDVVEQRQRIAALEAEIAELHRDAAKWRAFCAGWTDDDENGVSNWQGYSISHWTGEAWGPDGFRFDEGDIEAAKAACLEHFKGAIHAGG